MALDKETQQNMTELEQLTAMLNSSGWAICKKRFDEKVFDLQNIFNVDDEDPAKASVELRARKMASKLLFDWMKQDIYGFVEQQEQAKSSLMDARIESYIERTK